MSSYQTKLYLVTGKSCWVLVYSALLVALFSGTNFKDMIASLTWLCTLPPGWSVQWDDPSTGVNHPPTKWRVRTGFIDASHVSLDVFYCFCWDDDTWIIWVDGLYSTWLFWAWFVINLPSAAKLWDVWVVMCCNLWAHLRVSVVCAILE